VFTLLLLTTAGFFSSNPVGFIGRSLWSYVLWH